MTAHPATTGPLVIGIDAGGTRTRAALATARAGAAILSTGTAGPGNAMSVPPDTLAEHLRQAIAAATPADRRPHVHAVVAGLAGCSSLPGNPAAAVAGAALRSALDRLGIRARAVGVHSDTEIAFAGAPGAPSDGLILIAGTGAVAARIAGGRQVATADGDGWLLGDGGSGFWIGRKAVRKVLAALDGRGSHTALTAAVCCFYLGEPGPDEPPSPAAAQEWRDRIIRAVHDRPVLDLAALSPLVVEAAGQGDAVARGVLSGAAGKLTATLGPLAPRREEVLVTAGGLLGPEGALLEYLGARLDRLGVRPVPVPDGLAGAVALARAAVEV